MPAIKFRIVFDLFLLSGLNRYLIFVLSSLVLAAPGVKQHGRRQSPHGLTSPRSRGNTSSLTADLTDLSGDSILGILTTAQATGESVSDFSPDLLVRLWDAVVAFASGSFSRSRSAKSPNAIYSDNSGSFECRAQACSPWAGSCPRIMRGTLSSRRRGLSSRDRVTRIQ